jgi:hypothetical protein
VAPASTHPNIVKLRGTVGIPESRIYAGFDRLTLTLEEKIHPVEAGSAQIPGRTQFSAAMSMVSPDVYMHSDLLSCSISVSYAVFAQEENPVPEQS